MGLKDELQELLRLLPALPESAARAIDILQRLLDTMGESNPRKSAGLAFLNQLKSSGQAPGLADWLSPKPPPPPRPLPGAPPPRRL